MKAAVKFKLVLYADDSALLASSSDVTEIEEILKFKKKHVWCNALYLLHK